MKTKIFTLKASGKLMLLMLSLVTAGTMNSQCNAHFTDSVSGNTVYFHSNASGYSPTATHYWNFGDGTVLNFNGPANPNHTYAGSGSYFVQHMISDATTLCSDSDTNMVVINTTPPDSSCISPVSFSVHKDSLNPSSWSLYPNYSGSIASVIWSWGDGTMSTTMYPSHTYSVAGTYVICVVITGSCGDTSGYCLPTYVHRQANASESSDVISVQVINKTNTATGIKASEITDITEAGLYPNPSKDNAVLNISATTASTYKMNIYTIDGRVLISETINTVPGANAAELKTGGLQTGLYFISLTNGKEHKTLRLIKE